MKPIVVQKYGGSSVADPARLGRVADRVAATVALGKRVVVVVSAIGKTTDELLALARTVTPTPPRRELDMLLSCGERISMALLAMALEQRGLSAISFTGSQSGILTNDRHSGARIIEVRPVRLEDELARDKVVIVAGFQGMSYKREITTLGRGGSDTTAVALAAALAAEYCEICSDVDGVYSADPRVVPEARRLDEVSYDEMQELAEHGAKVLNAQAVEWARREKIVIYARATASPAGGDGQETRVGGEVHGGAKTERRGAVAVTGTKHLTVVHGDVLPIVEEERIVLRAAGPHCVSFVRDDVPDWPRVEKRLVQAGATIEARGQVVVVGTGVGSDAAIVGRALAAVGDCESWRAAPLRLDVTVAGERVDEVTRALHTALIQ
ncbi:MAG TPA: aspartate kinase [Polyangia bacterium]